MNKVVRRLDHLIIRALFTFTLVISCFVIASLIIIIQKSIIILRTKIQNAKFYKKIVQQPKNLKCQTRSHVGKCSGNEATSHHSYIDSGS